MSSAPKSPNFVRRPVATAPAAGPMFNPNGPPLKAGNTYVSDDVRRQLKIVGWNEGDIVPEGLPALLAQVQQKYGVAKQEVAVVGGKPRIGKVQSVDIKDLPPEAQAEIREFLSQARVLNEQTTKQAELKARREAMIPENASPSVREALEQYTEKAIVIDDEEEMSQAIPATPPPTQPEEPPAPTEPAVDPVCPQCGYDCRVPFDITVTAQDTMAHVAAQLDTSPNARFRKAVSLLNGELVVVYRSLTTKEAEAARLQTRKDVMDGKIVGEAEYYMTLFEYRLAMSVEKISDKNGAPIAEVPPLADIPNDDPDVPTLCKLVDFMNSDVYPNDSLKRNIGKHHRRFERLIEAMEAQESDPNFCHGIETRP